MLKQSELKDKLVEKLEISKAQADQFVNAYNEILIEDLLTTGKTKIQGVGTLEIRYRSPRNGVKPRTTDIIEIPESLTVGLVASTLIKKDLEEKVDISKYRKDKKA